MAQISPVWLDKQATLDNDRDCKQVASMAKQKGIDRREFGDFIDEEMKHASGKPGDANFTFEKLKDLADQFEEGG